MSGPGREMAESGDSATVSFAWAEDTAVSRVPLPLVAVPSVQYIGLNLRPEGRVCIFMKSTNVLRAHDHAFRAASSEGMTSV